MAIRAKLSDDVLKFYLRLREPKLSGSGKNLVIATTRGPAHTGIEYNGQEVLLVANAFIPNPKDNVVKMRRAQKKTPPAKAVKTQRARKKTPPTKAVKPKITPELGI